MPSTAKPTAWEQLREPFPAEQIGRIPKGGVQLSYVGHAAVTDRLLKVDPEWSWEPYGLDANGRPLLEENLGGAGMGEPYGLWIKLTVNGVTRPGFGGGKNAKECISDAIRNAAMRFGVALDLWAKEDLLGGNGDQPKAKAVTAAEVKTKFTAPTPPNGKPDEEAVKLATELLELVGQIGDGNGTKAELISATQALIGQHSGDKGWLRRQIAAAKKNLEGSAPIPF